MLVQRQFKPQIAKKLETISVEKLEKFLEIEKDTDEKETKWTRFVDSIENDPEIHTPEFQEAWRGVRKAMREVHENFEFKHDD